MTRSRNWTTGPILLLTVLLAAAGPFSAAASVPPASPVAPAGSPLVAPPRLAHIIVAVDRTGDTAFEQTLARGLVVQLNHFARRVDWSYADALKAPDVAAADAVVYVGLQQAPPASGYAALSGARRLVVFFEHLSALRAAGFFPHVTSSVSTKTLPSTVVQYGGQRFAMPAEVYTQIGVAPGATVYGSVSGTPPSPFAVTDGNATFVTAPLSFGTDILDPYAQGALLAACDVLRIALGAPPQPRIALLRLEDVSVQVPPPFLQVIVEYLAQHHVPYGIGVIPDQWIKGKTLISLKQDPELVKVLLYAQAHGARIILHGLHHSFNSPEDFEFWDHANNRPLPQDSVAWMRGKLDAGLTIERGLGLQPVMWESPHYAASPLDYGVVGTYFPMSWERRTPVAFAPWAVERDEYGSAVLPENLGYIANNSDPHMTLPIMLRRARAFTVCQDCVPGLFLHPTTVPVGVVKQVVEGIEALGYRFVDPLAVVDFAKSP
jgi:hypothetical protein